MQRVHILVSGQVQGVFFRHTAKKEAEKLDLTGWVRNVGDDKVEIVAEGEEDKLKELIAWCRNGPPLAQVENVEVEWKRNFERYNDFSII